MVDDGSTDGLSQIILDSIEKLEIENVKMLATSENLGKGFAINRGLKYSLNQGFGVVAFLDADFSTSLHELFRLVKILEHSSVDAVIGSRVLNDSNVIETKFYRLFLGRLFSSFIRRYLKIDIYDTQCGAKVFKVNDTLKQSVDQEVIDPWLYDLQLLVPIVRTGGSVLEIELKRWINQENSKFNIWKGVISVLKVKKIKQSLNYLKHNNLEKC
jgi:glycosyltransferase involved in cell wall biosynthesis